MCVCVMQLEGEKILTRICVLSVHLETVDCFTLVFIKALTRFLMYNPHGYMFSVEGCGFPGGCIPALPRASPGAGGGIPGGHPWCWCLYPCLATVKLYFSFKKVFKVTL